MADSTANKTPLATFYDPNNARPRMSQRLRDTVLKRDNLTCQYCGDHANTVDHIIPYTFGGLDREDNLIAACQWCNSKLSNRYFDDGVDGKRLYISEILHLKKRRNRRMFSICGDCKAVYRPNIAGATTVLCADCAAFDEDGRRGVVVPESRKERKQWLEKINRQIEEAEGVRIAEERAMYIA